MPTTEGPRERLEAIIDAAVFAIITINPDGTVEDFNPAAEKMFGHTAADVIGQDLGMLMPEPFRSAHDGFVKNYLKTGEKKIIGIGREVRGLHKDGRSFHIHLTVSEVKLGHRTIFTGMIENISARVDAEERVAQLQSELIHVARLSAMGELASALAHELNQPLTAITNYASAARRLIKSQKVDEATQLVLKAGDQAQRAGEIIHHLRQFIERGDTERGWANLVSTVSEGARLGLIGTQDHKVRFEMQTEDDLPEVMIDRVQIQQVVQNLVRNAVDAMRDQMEDQHILLEVMRRGTTQVDVVVEDSGPGLSEEVKKKLFQPFVTTKADGMGVGLSVCRNIVEAHGGRLTGENQHNGGARFRFTLPIIED
ncbi:MAG: PAS domain S-box protein [Pseudomonadota bacterium]